MLILPGNYFTETIEQNNHVEYIRYGLPMYVISLFYAVS